MSLQIQIFIKDFISIKYVDKIADRVNILLKLTHETYQNMQKIILV